MKLDYKNENSTEGMVAPFKEINKILVLLILKV